MKLTFFGIEFFALLMSCISVFSAIFFSLSQQKHNKNSVKPICEIILGDYENKIEVRLENVGTGPLIIKELRCIKNDTTQSNLMHYLPRYNNYDVFVEEINDRTIPVNGRIVLVSCSDPPEEIKKCLRASLKDVKISVEYVDIYGSQFTRSRELDFFGRTL
ncbi:hypothetical protein LJC31_07595 [Synergistaceae bacterium OttesenSCG-928-I11]|nr:hypothetical protein [Synergistaceae bacterium OttesenSCG-928-I11]